LSASVGLALAANPPTPPSSPGKTHVMKKTSDLQWSEGPSMLPPGAQMTLLEGDPAKEGYFAARLKLPAGYVIPPHFHPKEERLTIIEGTFELGMGDKTDESKYQSWPAGSYVSMSAGMHHFARAKTDVIVQLATLGPWGITYLNPADDPRNKKRPTN
jgi:quercetin dioxygenase-like cupin family protein